MKNKKIFICVLGSVLFLVIALFTKGFGLFKSKSPESPLSSTKDAFLSIPLSEITSQTKWYEYDLGDKAVKFFVVQAKDGSIKTAFDACDVCYYSGKGYRQEGDYTVCNNCGNRYPISGLGTENKNPGGCWPGYLPNIIQGDNVLIKKSDLENNRWRAL